MDVLSEVLRVVWLQELFYKRRVRPHKVFMSPDHMDWRTTLGLNASGWIAYHLLTEGRDSVRLDDGDRRSLEADDIVMIPLVRLVLVAPEVIPLRREGEPI